MRRQRLVSHRRPHNRSRHHVDVVRSNFLSALCVSPARRGVMSRLTPAHGAPPSAPNEPSRNDAVLALRRYKTNGVALDPRNPSHINAYLIVRRTMGRVGPDKVLAYLATSKENIEHGAESYSKYWGVPKVNFPGGVPADIQPFVQTADSLADSALLGGGSIDHETYYIIDKAVQRDRLGASLLTLKFFTSSRTTADKRILNPPTSSNDSVASQSQQHAACQPPAASQSSAASQPPAAAAIHAVGQMVRQPQATAPPPPVRSLKRNASDDPFEEPALKRARLLRETMTHLRDSLDQAIAAGHWYTESQWCRNSVLFFIQELLIVIEQLGPEGSDATVTGVNALADRVANYLEGKLLRHAPFEVMHHFESVLAKLDTLCRRPSGIRKILQTLSTTTRTTPTQLSFDDVDVVDRNSFWQTPLWQSFSEHTFKLMMATAKSEFAAAPTDTAWQTHAQLASHIRPVSDGLMATSHWALHLFSDLTPQAATLDTFMNQKTAVLKFMHDFAPSQPITFACTLLCSDDDDVSISTMSFDSWVAGATWLLAADVVTASKAVESCITVLDSFTKLVGNPLPGDHALMKLLALLVPRWRNTDICVMSANATPQPQAGQRLPQAAQHCRT